jgi:hypothetical protein
MKKDITYVVVSFGLVIVTAFFGSHGYSRQQRVIAEANAREQAEELIRNTKRAELESEQFALLKEAEDVATLQAEEERLTALQAEEEAKREVEATNATAQANALQTTQTQVEEARVAEQKRQATLLKTIQDKAAVLAEQLALEKKIAEQAARDAAQLAAKKSARRSRAS